LNAHEEIGENKDDGEIEGTHPTIRFISPEINTSVGFGQ